MNIIERIRRAQPRWIIEFTDDPNNGLEPPVCSKCGAIAPSKETKKENGDIHIAYMLADYCPECKRRMRRTYLTYKDTEMDANRFPWEAAGIKVEVEDE